PLELHESGPRHNEVNRARCRLLAVADYPRLARTTLLAKPLRHAPLDFILIDEVPAFCCLQTPPDGLLNIDVVVNILERGFFGEGVEQLPNLFFRPSHRSSLPPHTNRRSLPGSFAAVATSSDISVKSANSKPGATKQATSA